MDKRSFLTGEQRRFFEDLLAYLRDELEARKDPEAAEQRARMFAPSPGKQVPGARNPFDEYLQRPLVAQERARRDHCLPLPLMDR